MTKSINIYNCYLQIREAFEKMYNICYDDVLLIYRIIQ